LLKLCLQFADKLFSNYRHQKEIKIAIIEKRGLQGIDDKLEELGKAARENRK
jgi:hypothetical protein